MPCKSPAHRVAQACAHKNLKLRVRAPCRSPVRRTARACARAGRRAGRRRPPATWPGAAARTRAGCAHSTPECQAAAFLTCDSSSRLPSSARHCECVQRQRWTSALHTHQARLILSMYMKFAQHRPAQRKQCLATFGAVLWCPRLHVAHLPTMASLQQNAAVSSRALPRRCAMAPRSWGLL